MKYNTLYPCQEVAIGHAVEFIKAAKPGDKQMYAAPTGIGKSVVQLHVQKRLNACMPGAHWIATPRDEIIAGMIDKLGLPKGTDAFPLHISTPTILRNRMLRGELPKFPASLTFDEGHHHNAETYQQLTLLTGYCPSLAYTATPYRGSPASTRQLREFWGDPLWIISYAEAFAEGYIKLPTFTTLPLVDDDVVSINGGEFSIESIEGATMDRLSDLAEHSKQWYGEHGWNKPTIYSLSSKLLCNRLNQELGQRGLPSIVVTAETTPADRELAFDACEKGIVAILQINVVSEGVDLKLRRLVDLSPTMSPVKWMQQIGRIMRPTTDQPEYICIAEDEPVLTDNGWKSIQHVELTDRVWDGLEWVSHSGVVCNGRKEVVSCNGVLLTPDHSVLTDAGMVEAWHLNGTHTLSAQRLTDGRLSLNRTESFCCAGAEHAEKLSTSMGEICKQENRNAASVAHEASQESEHELIRGRTRILSDLGSVSLTPSPVVLTQDTDNGNTTVGEGSWFTHRGSNGQNCLSNTCLHSNHGATLRSDSTAPIIMETTNPETSASSPVQSQATTGETTTPKAVTPGVLTTSYKPGSDDRLSNSEQEVRHGQRSLTCIVPTITTYKHVYDILNAGPRHRFQVRGLIVKNCTNRNMLRHSYAMEGCVPVTAISEATKLWPDSERSNVRAIGLEAIGRFKPATVKLRSGVNCHLYSVSTVAGGKVVEYSCVVHPCSDPIWCTKVNTRDAAGNRSWGSWEKCPAPESLTGFASVPPADLTPKQRAWWDRSAAGMGLDEKQEVTRKNFVILPVLTNIGVRL